jgi:probable F420-dependent oxidoreductase
MDDAVKNGWIEDRKLKMTRPIRIGVQLSPGGAPDYPAWRAAVIRAENIGAAVIFGSDHFHPPVLDGFAEGRPVLSPEQHDINNFEGWTALASWGEITSSAEIGLLVTGIGFRNPDLLADMARTVDHISSGRLILGLGSGWHAKDYSSYGYNYGTTKSRLDLFDAAVERIERRLALLVPPPRRDIPILIGGTGERRSLPAVARHADIWHTFVSDIDVYRHKSKLVAELAAAAGRDDAAIERSVAWFSAASADELLAAGATLFIADAQPTPDGYDFTLVEQALSWHAAIAG